MNYIIDTQIVSAHFKGGIEKIPGKMISSITANEFLWVYSKEGNSPNYYILNPTKFCRYHSPLLRPTGILEHFNNAKWAKLGARRTDQVIIDFNNQFQSYVEYGSEAVAKIINNRITQVYDLSIAHIEKRKKRYLKQRMSYLLDFGYECAPINEFIVETTARIFSIFTEQYAFKGNIRNSINDLLILSTAIDRKVNLLTKDNLLNRFAAEVYKAPVKKHGESIEINFTTQMPKVKKNNKESKGYINRGWSYSFIKGSI